MKQFFVTIFLLFVFYFHYGQTSFGGLPFTNNTNERIREPRPITITPIDRVKIDEEDIRDEEIGASPRFGVQIATDINNKDDGAWTNLANGDRVWICKIKVTGALASHIIYRKLWIPRGASLYLYNSDKSHIIGGFDERINKGTAQTPQLNLTGIVFGEEVTLEYYEPASVLGQGVIQIQSIVNDYRMIPGLSSYIARGFEDSDATCQIDINCPLGDDWQNEKRGVGLLAYDDGDDGYRFCTGSLVNNTRQDGAMLFLTADHCLANSDIPPFYLYDAVDAPSANPFFVIWNYEKEDCNVNQDGSTNITSVGATVLANDFPIDFAILKLHQNPMDNNPPFTPQFNGWSLDTDIQGGTVGIHHPWGDVKKISIDEQPPIPADYLSSGVDDNKNWEVDFEEGTVEKGSSGSPLFNNDKLIIGALRGKSGGGATGCELTIAQYGMISEAWVNQNGTTSPQRRLKDWLDPIGFNPTFLASGVPFPCQENQVIEDPISSGKSIKVEKKITSSGTIQSGNYGFNMKWVG